MPDLQSEKEAQPTMRVKDRRYWLEADLIAWEQAQLPHGEEECAR